MSVTGLAESRRRPEGAADHLASVDGGEADVTVAHQDGGSLRKAIPCQLGPGS